MEKINHRVRIPLKEIFPGGAAGGEAHDWTPSLFNNEYDILTDLCTIIGINIEPNEMEHWVWGKSLKIDILGINTDTDNKVIIENQFGTSDDSHMSRIMKYRTGIIKQGYNVDAVIWLVEEADDPTISVMRDLNDNITSTNWYLIQVIAEKDVSTDAKYLDYNVIVKPDKYVEQKINDNNEYTENDVNRINFWRYLAENLSNEVKNEFTSLSNTNSTCKKPSKWFNPHWIENQGMSLSFTSKGALVIRLLLGEENQIKYDYLQSQNLPFIFADVEKYKYRELHLRSHDNEFDINNRNDWNNMAKWFDENLKTFIKYKNIIIEQI